MQEDAKISLGLRLKAAATLVAVTLRHPTKTSRIILDPKKGSVHVEYEEDRKPTAAG